MGLECFFKGKATCQMEPSFGRLHRMAPMKRRLPICGRCRRSNISTTSRQSMKSSGSSTLRAVTNCGCCNCRIRENRIVALSCSVLSAVGDYHAYRRAAHALRQAKAPQIRWEGDQMFRNSRATTGVFRSLISPGTRHQCEYSRAAPSVVWHTPENPDTLSWSAPGSSWRPRPAHRSPA